MATSYRFKSGQRHQPHPLRAQSAEGMGFFETLRDLNRGQRPVSGTKTIPFALKARMGWFFCNAPVLEPWSIPDEAEQTSPHTTFAGCGLVCPLFLYADDFRRMAAVVGPYSYVIPGAISCSALPAFVLFSGSKSRRTNTPSAVSKWYNPP